MRGAQSEATVAVHDPYLVGLGVEPPGDAADLVDEVGSQRHVGLGGERRRLDVVEPGERGIGIDGPAPQQHAVLDLGAELARALDHHGAGVSQPLHVALSPQRAAEGRGAIAHVGRFLEALRIGEGGHLPRSGSSSSSGSVVMPRTARSTMAR